MKILVVEDEPRAAEYLRQGLSENGYVVETALTGAEALHSAMNGDHALILLDIMLPGFDGFAILSAIRTSKYTPVLMLTARSNTDDKLKGFDLGADDYLVKPYQFPELLARIRALLKRGTSIDPNASFQIADLYVDPVKHRAVRAGNRIDLSAKEYALLVLLMRRHGHVLSRVEIASLVWDINFESETNVVDVAIRRLRAKVDDPYELKLIHTVRGVGYVFKGG